MLERFTVDVLAENVATQLIEGEPTPKLAHRFFRKGRRDGKRAYDHASVSKLLTDAVHLAGSTLAENLTSARRAATLRIAECEAAIEKHATMGDAPAPEEAPTEAERPDPLSSTSDHRDSAHVLTEALAARKNLGARRQTEAIVSEARAKRRARVDALEAAESAATQAREEVGKLRGELSELPEEYKQRFESIKHTGELLWARYCNGFVQGEGRRGSRASDVAMPTGSLRFETPPALLQPDLETSISSNEGSD